MPVEFRSFQQLLSLLNKPGMYTESWYCGHWSSIVNNKLQHATDCERLFLHLPMSDFFDDFLQCYNDNLQIDILWTRSVMSKMWVNIYVRLNKSHHSHTPINPFLFKEAQTVQLGGFILDSNVQFLAGCQPSQPLNTSHIHTCSFILVEMHCFIVHMPVNPWIPDKQSLTSMVPNIRKQWIKSTSIINFY